jgi:3-hydroxymyristoyl/3-hydroxydecanoyl-(acyl carrier protein) dehydratase
MADLVTNNQSSMRLVDTSSLKTFAQANTLNLLQSSTRVMGIIGVILVEFRRQLYADNKIAITVTVRFIRLCFSALFSQL